MASPRHCSSQSRQRFPSSRCWQVAVPWRRRIPRPRSPASTRWSASTSPSRPTACSPAIPAICPDGRSSVSYMTGWSLSTHRATKRLSRPNRSLRTMTHPNTRSSSNRIWRSPMARRSLPRPMRGAGHSRPMRPMGRWGPPFSKTSGDMTSCRMRKAPRPPNYPASTWWMTPH